MTNWFKRSVGMAYFPTKDEPLKERWVRIRGVAEGVGISPQAKEKEEEERIIHLRKSHLKWGKKKLTRLYANMYREKISAWKVERVVRKWSLFPNQEKHQKYLKIKSKRKVKVYIKDFEVPSPKIFCKGWCIWQTEK